MAVILNHEKNELVIGVREIKTNFLGLSILGELSSRLLQVNPGPVTLNFQNLTWFDAHLCSALGALLLRHGDHLYKFVGLPQKIDEIFRRNGFNTFYGAEALSDGWGSTMQFRKFNNSDTFDKIAEYLEIELANKSVPIMSPQLRDHFIQSISEIFQNSCIHSRTPDNYCICGQYFHQSGLLNITFSDTGVGFARNFLDYIGEQIAPHEAIAWAVKKGNSTSRNHNGGKGLSFIIEFLKLNRGSLRIISDAGYWESRAGELTVCNLMRSSFSGTIVIIEINTNDENQYALKSEIEEIPF